MKAIFFSLQNKDWKNSVLSCTGLEHKTSTIPMLCSTNWAKNPTRSWSQFWFQVNPWSDEKMKMTVNIWKSVNVNSITCGNEH